MSGSVACFLIVATDRYRVKLRRYSSSGELPCAARGEWGCDASVALHTETRAEHPTNGDDPARYPHDDARWPAACAHCGRAFDGADAWQVFYENVYLRADGTPGEHFLRALASGAMYDATWLHGNAEMCGPDGRSFILRLPDGLDWTIDGPSKGGGHWTRTGDAPRITARPSILTHKADGGESYHGWLTDGVLVPC